MRNRRLAFDKKSARTFDSQGFLHVASTPITRAGVRPYYGRELPGWEDFGLEASRVYNVFCPPEELEKAATTFNGVPLLIDHAPESADNPQKELRVGSVGTSPRFVAPYLCNDLTVTDATAISLIEDEKKVELSASYAFIPEMSSGEYDGEHYDIIMRDIQGNHVALVEEGRAGPDVRVADEKPKALKGLRMDKEKILGLLAQLTAIFKGEDKVEDEDAEGKPVADNGDVDISNNGEGSEADGAEGKDDKVADEEPEAIAGKDDNLENKEKATAAENVVNVKIEKEAGGLDEHPGAPEGQVVMDAAAIEANIRKRLRAQNDAARMCRPILGDIDPLVYDSANGIYGAALKAMGYDPKRYSPQAYAGMVKVALDMRRGNATQTVVMDSAHGNAGVCELDDTKVRLPRVIR